MKCLAVIGMVMLSITSFRSHAQPCPILYGQVLDGRTGEALPGANVRWSNSLTGTSTGHAGQFELKNMNDSLKVSFIGYHELKLKPDSCRLMLYLEPSSTGLTDVVIKGERLIAEEFTVKKYNRLDIYTNPSAKADPILAVNSSPSATTLDESANISLRGSSPAETGIFLNNVPIHDAVRYSQLNGIGTFSIFNTALVSSVQVYPGNPPLEFGNTTSGLIALQTDETIPSKPVHTLSFTLASMGFYLQRKLSSKSALTAFSNYQPSAMIKFLNPVALKDLSSFNSIDLGLHFYLKPDERTVLKVFNYGIHESYRYFIRMPTYEGDFAQDKIRNFTVANFRRRLSHGEISINTGVSFSFANYSISVMRADIGLKDFFGSVNYQYFAGKSEIKAGVSYDFRSSDFKGTFPTYSYALGPQYPVDSARSVQEVKLPEVYFYGKYFLGSQWTIGGGVRKNIELRGQNGFLSGQLNLNFKPSKEWNIILSAGRYNKFQLPQGENVFVYHIEADQYSFDVNYKKTNTEHSASFFYKESKYENTHAAIKGLELFTRHKFSRNLRGQISITSLDASLADERQAVHSPYDIHYFLHGNLEYKIGGTWTFSATFLFRQGSFYLPVGQSIPDPRLGVYVPIYGEASRLPDYRLVDFSISKLFIIRQQYSSILFTGIGNIFNFKNVRSYTYNFDYSSTEPQLFSQRAIYFGWILNF